MLIMLPYIRQIEEYLAKIFSIFRKRTAACPLLLSLYLQIASVNPSGLNEDQKQAFSNALIFPISLISGPAGSGKTYVINAITNHYENELGKTVLLLAPTGKAARRMEETTGHKAYTIHIGIEYSPRMDCFQRNESNPLDADVVIVDEVSMLDSILGYHLFKAIDLTRTVVVLVGDHNQLPPVGPGNILRDIFETEAIPTAVLIQVVRQAGALKKNCTAILTGIVEKTCPPDDKGNVSWQLLNHYTDAEQCRGALTGAFKQMLTNHPKADIIHGMEVLIPQKKGILGCDALNVELQRIAQQVRYDVTVDSVPEGRRPKLYQYDKIIQTKNDYSDEIDCMNGTLGQVVEMLPDGQVIVKFEGREETNTIPTDKLINLSLAYCLTIHKCQGSEFPMVLLIIHKNHSFMHTRNLLYTGATRAKKKLIIMGDGWGIRNCASNVSVDTRKTWLRVLLKRENE